jgi:hypothetical protein
VIKERIHSIESHLPSKVLCENRTRLTGLEDQCLCRSAKSTLQFFELNKFIRRPSVHTISTKSTQRESNPHIRHGKAVGSRYIMGAFNSLTEKQRAQSGTRTHVTALRKRHLRL